MNIYSNDNIVVDEISTTLFEFQFWLIKSGMVSANNRERSQVESGVIYGGRISDNDDVWNDFIASFMLSSRQSRLKMIKLPVGCESSWQANYPQLMSHVTASNFLKIHHLWEGFSFSEKVTKSHGVNDRNLIILQRALFNLWNRVIFLFSRSH